jgi:ABC-2 type transport system ATP-binding protein
MQTIGRGVKMAEFISDEAQNISLPVDSVVEAKDLTKQFGDQLAVDRISFSIPRGSIFGFIGPSGCGKTTTVRLLTGIYKPTGGEESFCRALINSPRHVKIPYAQNLPHPDLTVWEN